MALNIIQNYKTRGNNIRNRHHSQPRKIMLLCETLSCLIMAIVWLIYFYIFTQFKGSSEIILLKLLPN